MKKFICVILSFLFVMTAYSQEKKVLVAYFSCTGNTRQVARTIAEATGGDLFEIRPAVPYTDKDLDWRDKKSRSTVEMEDESCRPQMAEGKVRTEDYDIIFLGYPIWWYTCPRIINTFLESCNVAGKTVIPFATSGSSGIESSETNLKRDYPEVKWQKGRLLNEKSETIAEWAKQKKDSMK